MQIHPTIKAALGWYRGGTIVDIGDTEGLPVKIVAAGAGIELGGGGGGSAFTNTIADSFVDVGVTSSAVESTSDTDRGMIELFNYNADCGFVVRAATVADRIDDITGTPALMRGFWIPPWRDGREAPVPLRLIYTGPVSANYLLVNSGTGVVTSPVSGTRRLYRVSWETVAA